MHNLTKITDPIIERLPILNIWVDKINNNTILNLISEFIEEDKRLHTIFASNPEKNFSVLNDPTLYSEFQKADILIPDGIGIVLAAKLLHKVKLTRIPGCELMENICALSQKKGYKIFIYGAAEKINKKAVKNLKQKYPDINIVGRCNGYIGDENMLNLVRQINKSGAQILFLALGSPRQEKWIASYKKKLTSVRICQGIGGTLDVLAGEVKRAPELYCKLGLEWLYRLLSEPKRINRQKVLPVFVLQILRQILSGKNSTSLKENS